MKTIRQSAIETAIRNADRDADKYIVESTWPGYITVQKIANPSDCYLVSRDATLFPERCQCEYYKRENVCKHEKLADDFIRIEEIEAEIADSLTYDAYPKY